MTATLTGTLTPDGRRIVLAGSGDDDFDLNMIGTRLGMLTPLLTVPKGMASGNIMLAPCTWPTIVQLGHIFNGNGHAGWQPQGALLDWVIAETARRAMPPSPLPANICPPGLVPRDYQREDAAALAAAGKAFLLHEPGMGKTVISVLGLEARRRAGHTIFPMIIVVPGWQVADVWDTHIREWAPHWPAPVMHKGTGRLDRLAAQRGRDFILITTYATARLDAALESGPLPRIRPAAAISDEAQLIGNDDSKQSQAWQRIAKHASSVIIASGTLITHDMRNVYPAVASVDPVSFPAWDRFKPRYIAARKDPSGYKEKITGLREEMEHEFFACFDGQLIRRAKNDVLDQLPPKIYSVRRPEMPPEWRRAYDTMRDQMLAELPDGGELPVMDTIVQLTRLSQLASSAADVTTTEEWNEETQTWVTHYHVILKRPCWKAESLLEILAERPGMPTAVFTESRQLAMLMGEYCEEAGYKTGYLVGTGKDGITDRTRKQAVEDFQAGYLNVIIGTAGAGGLGITLTASNCAVMAQRPWRLDDAIQPEDRVHRIGSERWDKVEIIDLVTQYTIDSYRRTVLKGKAGQWGQLIRDPRFVRELLGGLPA